MRLAFFAVLFAGIGLAPAACSHESPPPMVPDPVEAIGPGAAEGDAAAAPTDASPDSPLIPLLK
jgi:hypothetical protein